MRTHARHARLAPRVDAELFHSVVRAEHLLCARIDPCFGFRTDSEGLLDLAFAANGAVVLVPFLALQAVMILMRESSPYIWPAWMPPLREDVSREIEARLDPWVKSLMIGRFANDERFVLFGDDAEARALALRAREYGFLGAAPIESVVRAVGPYVYAQRFARGRRVGAVDPDGASGAAVLARTAGAVRVDLGDAERRDAARRWFGLDAFESIPAGASFDVAIGTRDALPDAPVRIVLDAVAAGDGQAASIAVPIPPAVMVSFDPSDGAAMRHLAIAAPTVPPRPSGLPAMPSVGGSSGRIALVVRSDYLGNEDADSDAARALASRLAEQGFSPAVVPANHVRPRDFDLLHVFGMRAAADLEPKLLRVPSHPPLVVTPYVDDARREAAWGTAIVASTLGNAPDETLRRSYFAALRARRLESQGLPKVGDAVLDPRPILARAGAVVAASDDEATRLRDEFGVQASRVVPGVLAASAEPADVAALCGTDDFVLMHAPVESRCNQYPVVRAAAGLGYPIVLVGSVQDTAFFSESVGEFGDYGLWLGSDQITPEQLAGLYARCRVFADASWSSTGLYRLLRAGAAGAALVAPSSGYARGVWPGLVQIVDPASHENIREGLRDAWQRAPELGPATARRTAEVADPFRSLVGVLAAYQLASQAVSSQS